MFSLEILFVPTVHFFKEYLIQAVINVLECVLNTVRTQLNCFKQYLNIWILT